MLPLFEKLAVLVEDLNAVVAAVADEEAASRIERQRVDDVDSWPVPRGVGAPWADQVGQVRRRQRLMQQRDGGRAEQHVADVIGAQHKHA